MVRKINSNATHNYDISYNFTMLRFHFNSHQLDRCSPHNFLVARSFLRADSTCRVRPPIPRPVKPDSPDNLTRVPQKIWRVVVVVVVAEIPCRLATRFDIYHEIPGMN